MPEPSELLSDIAQWVTQVRSPDTFKDETDFMVFLVEEAMPRCSWLIRAAVATVPRADPNFRGFTKRQAVVVGHMVRITKLYDAFHLHAARRQLEIVGVMARLIFDTKIRLEYLLKRGGPKTYRSFVLASYRSERENLLHFSAIARLRHLTPIEQRMRSSILRAMRSDGISRRTLQDNRVWDMDGKNVRAMLEALGRGSEYSFSFGNTSGWVHGNWLELKQYHLIREGNRYFPRLDWGDPDTRTAGPMSWLVLSAANSYLAWSKGDPTGTLSLLISSVADIIQRVDEDHERRLSENGTVKR